ncbi:hypothetical protein SteCoe_13521 [Stentor coeruleus]|uniref:Uncharacterized protein n=1 Tax=Stentor coeruleus TaxID=5963 RepID=A0A1R2C881_9CILI|nr:hypothetical protein SteCoe_13521 [Stentor coeruleus]
MSTVMSVSKKKKDNTICYHFFYIKSTNNRSLKKEDLRTKLFRKHKTFLLKVLKSKAKVKKIEQTLGSSKLIKFKAFCTHYIENSYELVEVVKDEYQPRNNFALRDDSKHRSYNDKFTSEYFSKPMVKKSFILMLDYLFYEAKIDELSIMFKVEARDKANERKDWTELIAFIYSSIAECTYVGRINYSGSEFQYGLAGDILIDELFDVDEVLDLSPPS